MRFLLIILLFSSPVFLFSQIVAGPMPCCTDYKEALVWVQTSQSAKVRMQYVSVTNPDEKFLTAEIKTDAQMAFTAKLLADRVKPGMVYNYLILINGKAVKPKYRQQFTTPALWQWRTAPPDYSFALGSCTYVNEPDVDRPGKPYGGGNSIFGSIAASKPAFMLWLGDNAYLREVDWNTTTGILHRYSHTRALPEMQQLLAETHHYAIWDDHDFGPNNSDRSFLHKDKALHAFNCFWGNPTCGIPGAKGITSKFQWSDGEFLLLDNRYHRAPNDTKDSQKTMLGAEQLQWLKDALINSQAPFKFIALGGQFLNDAAVYECYSANGFNKERNEIIDFIYLHNIKGVVFLTGDRHHSEISKLTQPGKPDIVDITISPLTSGTHSGNNEKNTLRVPGSLIDQRNYCKISVSGPQKQRKLSVDFFDETGKQLYSYSITQN